MRCLLRGQARSYRIFTVAEVGTVPVGAGSPANTSRAGAMPRGVIFAGKPAPTGLLCVPTEKSPHGGVVVSCCWWK
ncbi:hypothetical protein E6B08_18430 [Pseudomonas putida]|uniref:Uncharacterized protein n=1 Tax=Pseudomonas putida TaxID=303 RepID=A0A4D6XF97_PSEPU|nr:hypothetical protein E6B08_18430 [Pseudomonas putida]